jgi:Eukaryotic aspartyl protease
VLAFVDMTRYSMFVSVFVALIACGGSSNNSGGDAGGSGSNTGPVNGVYTIPLTAPDGPVEFYAPLLTVGGVQFAMDLDTGSTTTAIAGSACTDCNQTPDVPTYMLSPTYTPGSGATDEHLTADSEYADGTGWYGEVWDDTISLEHGTPSATINIVDISTQIDPNDKQNAMAGFFQDNGYQGILGMGPPGNAVGMTGAYFQAISGSGGVAPIMAFEMCSTDGTMWFGGYDATHASGAMSYAVMDPIDDNNPFYSVSLTGASVGSSSVSGSASADDLSLWTIDTGTSVFVPTTPVYDAAVASIEASSGYKALFGSASFDPTDANPNGCVTALSAVTDDQVDQMLPPFVMTMTNAAGGSDIAVSAPALSSYLYDNGSNQFCTGMFDGGDEAIIGDELLQGFIVVVDQKNGQVGWATDGGCAHGDIARAPHDRTKHLHMPRPRAALRHRNR